MFHIQEQMDMIGLGDIRLAENERYVPKIPKERDYTIETVLKYTPSDGGVGYIVKIKPKSKEKK